MHSSFTRWFISQFGQPPATWRAQHEPHTQTRRNRSASQATTSAR